MEKATKEGKPIPEVAEIDFVAAARRSLGQISWEPIPQDGYAHAGDVRGASGAGPEYHKDISGAFLDPDGSDIVAKRLGLPRPGDFEAPGYFEGKVSPGTQTEVAAPPMFRRRARRSSTRAARS
ncbi:MAG: hypothetical protein IPM60_12260 [Rhodospirillales bacterium]|nr:hypothetical protein [Rhodospirillales bacterium]